MDSEVKSQKKVRSGNGFNILMFIPLDLKGNLLKDNCNGAFLELDSYLI